MNREIKFRAWDKVTKEMIDLGELFCTITEGSHLAFAVEDSYGHQWKQRETEEFELMQFTGLKDKNGKEIYEGDIVGFLGGNWLDEVLTPKKGVVQWSAEHLHYEVVCNGEPIPDLRKSYDDGKMEVIGNIYQNPDLI